LTVQDYNEEHEKCLNFIKKAMNESKAKTKIIVTHHVPSSLLYTEESDLDIVEGTAVDLTDYIKNCGAKYWIFGHSHQNIDEVIIGETRCLCNHVGYVQWYEQSTFDNSKFIDLGQNEIGNDDKKDK
jgi:Icc-related predicted phosphoesterase